MIEKGKRTMSTFMTTTRKYVSTPGEILLEEFLEPLGISQYRLAQAMHVGQTAVGQIIAGRRAISTAMAFRLAKALGTTPEFWLNLQHDYELLAFDNSQVGNIQRLV